MSANLYDLLDVDETASTAEIRAAWKASVADLDPTDRRFRAFNDAAEVLLDDERRASYDASLAEARAAEEPLEPPVGTPAATLADEPPGPDDQPAPESREESTPVAARSTRAGAAGPSNALLVAAGIAALLSALLAAWILTLDGSTGESPAEVEERAATQERAGLDAESAAEQMVPAVLSYNHQTMDEDLARLSEYLTPAMAEKQSAAWPELTKEAQAQQIVVEAQPGGTALTRVSPDGDRATVVAFIDQYVEKAGAEPFVLRMWATMSLVRAAGDGGQWLLDDLCTDASCE